MKIFDKVKSRYLVGIIVGIIFILWNIIVFVATDMERAKVNFWWGYSFVALAFVITALVVIFTTIPKQTVYAVIFPFYTGTIVYFAVTLIYNIFMIAFPDGEDVKVPVIPNIFIIAFYIIYMIIVFIGARHMTRASQKINQSATDLRLLTANVKSLEAEITSEAAKTEVLNLASDIRYSDPMGNAHSAPIEEELDRAIQILKEKVYEDAGEEEIVKAAKKCRAILRNRNAVLKASKIG